MFRELSRKNQKLTREECIELLEREKRGVLSMTGEDGYPYAIPLNHYYDAESGKLYFHCGKAGAKRDLLSRNDKVCYVVTEQGTRKEGEWWLTVKSVLAFGRVETSEDPTEIARIAKKLCAKFTDDEAYVRREIEKYTPATLLLSVTIDHLSGKWVKEK